MTELASFLAACRAFAGDESDQGLHQATGRFLDAAAAEPALAVRAAAALPDLGPDGAGWLAVILGSHMETHGGAADTAPAVVAALWAWLPLLAPDREHVLRGFAKICQATVAHLARLPDYRAKLAAAPGALARLEEAEALSHGAAWVREALLRRSGPLIALHPTSGSGLRLRYHNVANTFHLCSLLQVAIGSRLPGGREPDPGIARAARGEAPGHGLRDQAWWHYGNSRSPVADVHASLWGEDHVSTIPSLDDAQIVLLWPPILRGRGWNGGFFGCQLAAMPPDVVLEEVLTQSAARALCARLGVVVGPRPADPTPPRVADERRGKWWRFGK